MANRWILPVGALLAGLAVAAGAMGAHALKDVLGEEAKGQYTTAVTYQMYHALALVMLGWWPQRGRLFTAAAIFFTVGVLLFSGCLYGYIFTGQKPLVMIVPIGGFSFLIGWAILLAGALKRPRIEMQ